MSNNSLEIVHEGWLIKSPPRKPIWRARWRRRWFVLRHSGELPGQYFLEYYTDRNCRKLKGKIDLDQCDQVDAGLKFENRKQKYPYLFDVRTPKRIFYLAAESEKDMNKWVDCVCHVCGLKAYSHEDEYYDFMPPARELQGEGPVLTNHHELSVVPDESSTLPRVSGSNTPSSLSGPYIPISECISGRPLNGNGLVQLKLNGDALTSDTSLTLHHNNIPHWSKEKSGPHTLPRPCSSSFSSKSSSHVPLDLPGEFYDMPRRLHPPNLEGIDQGSAVGTPPLHSPATTAGGTDGESVNLTEEEDWGNGHLVNSMTAIHGPPSVNWNTYPRDGEGPPMIELRERALAEDMATLKFARRYAKMSIAEDSTDRVPQSVAPPRPPKPLHLMEATANKHSYLNLDSISPKYSSEAVESVRSSDGEPSPGIVLRQNNANPHSPGQSTSTVVISDETYDFPRSHQPGESSREPRHLYSNAAPGRMNEVFCYDFNNEDGKELDEAVVVVEEPTSPRSESSSLASSTVIYSNLPSPLCGPGQVPSEAADGNQGTSGAPPIVNRDLKPGRKTSDSTSHDLSPGIYPVSHVVPPTVDRTLKPYKKVQDVPLLDPGPIKLASPPACRTSSDNRSWRKPRAAPSPTPPASAPSTLRGVRCQSANSISDEDAFSRIQDYAEDEVVYYTRNHKNQFSPAIPSHKSFETIQYLDLDHPETTGLQQQVPKSPDRSQASGIVYKTVDFVKTEAFQRTKQEVEKVRKCT